MELSPVARFLMDEIVDQTQKQGLNISLHLIGRPDRSRWFCGMVYIDPPRLSVTHYAEDDVMEKALEKLFYNITYQRAIERQQDVSQEYLDGIKEGIQQARGNFHAGVQE